MLISFDDSATSTSNIKFIRQASALNLSKLQGAYDLYWMVSVCGVFLFLLWLKSAEFPQIGYPR